MKRNGPRLLEERLIVGEVLGECRAAPGEAPPAGRAATARRSVTVNLAEAPLGWLFARGHVTRRQYLAGELELEFNPQGTLAERLRAGGAGIPAFFTRTGYGTIVAEGKETREFDGHYHVMETALKADVSLVKAWKADTAGNLLFRKTARNFNPAVAMAGRVCIVEVEELVDVGAIDPDHVHLPGIYVDRIVHNPNPEKRIEQRTVRTA